MQTQKNILVLTGSPRKNGNSDRLADAFIEGARFAGHTVFKFKTAAGRIKGCTACDACWSMGTACVDKDGFTELEPLLENADVIVFATPLYWFTLPSQLKAAIDKLYAYCKPDCKRALKIRESVFMVCGEDDDTKAFKGITQTYKSIAAYMKWQDRGIQIVPGVAAKDDITRTDALDKGRILGMEI